MFVSSEKVKTYQIFLANAPRILSTSCAQVNSIAEQNIRALFSNRRNRQPVEFDSGLNTVNYDALGE